MISHNEQLCRMARFGANISDAYGCYVFLPTQNSNALGLAGFHSLSNDVIRDCEIQPNNGLIGWVAKHKRSIHVSPFERDSRTLGFYHQDQSLKSFIGIPIFTSGSQNTEEALVGVVACDSKKSFAFSKLQGKLLEDLACEISSHLHMVGLLQENGLHKLSWQSFFNRSNELLNGLGRDSIEVVRMNIKNYQMIEQNLGTARTLPLLDQLFRLIEQALPPHFPCIRLPNGDLLMVVDNMMTSFLENKIQAICEYCSSRLPTQALAGSCVIRVGFVKRLAGAKKYRMLGLEDLINCTADEELSAERSDSQSLKKLNLVYEYKRA